VWANVEPIVNKANDAGNQSRLYRTEDREKESHVRVTSESDILRDRLDEYDAQSPDEEALVAYDEYIRETVDDQGEIREYSLPELNRRVENRNQNTQQYRSCRR